MQPPAFYPIGTPGQAWGPAELAQWRARQVRQRSHAQDVLAPIRALGVPCEVLPYGELVCEGEHFPLVALRSAHWQPGLPCALVTGGVHGYETSGVHGALRFVAQHAQAYTGRVNWLVVPCVSPWAYERIHRWNANAVDPNRAFREPSPSPEAAALMRLVAQTEAAHGSPFVLHMDLHETTDTDESEFRPALAARDGKPFTPGTIPDGFYVVDDTANPQPAFQQAIVNAVARVTHIAPADGHGNLIGSPAVASGVIRYPFQALGLCAGMTGARFTATTEVYPDSPRATPEQCIAAQVAAVCAALDFVLAAGLAQV